MNSHNNHLNIKLLSMNKKLFQIVLNNKLLNNCHPIIDKVSKIIQLLKHLILHQNRSAQIQKHTKLYSNQILDRK